MRTLLIGSGINQVKKIKETCYAIDISQEYLDAAKKLCPKNKYINADVQNMPFASNFFDKIVFTHVLEHVPNPEQAISEIYRVLKSGGILLLEVPANERESFLSKKNKVFKRDIYEGYHKTQYTEKKLKKQLMKFKISSFKKIKGRDIVFWYLWGILINLFKLEKSFYIEECGQIHSKKNDFLTKQCSRILFLINILLSPVLFKNIIAEYAVMAKK